MNQARRIKIYVDKNFYPHETTHGTFMKLDEEMEREQEFSAGWNEATKNK
jgi:hypothetical protein